MVNTERHRDTQTHRDTERNKQAQLLFFWFSTFNFSDFQLLVFRISTFGLHRETQRHNRETHRHIETQRDTNRHNFWFSDFQLLFFSDFQLLVFWISNFDLHRETQRHKRETHRHIETQRNTNRHNFWFSDFQLLVFLIFNFWFSEFQLLVYTGTLLRGGHVK